MYFNCGSLNMIFDVFLSRWACIGIFLGLILINSIFNLLIMILINHKTKFKTQFSKQSFIKRFLLMNNPNYPSKSFVIITKINYVALIILLLATICHMIIYSQITSIIVQIASILEIIILGIFIIKIR